MLRIVLCITFLLHSLLLLSQNRQQVLFDSFYNLCIHEKVDTLKLKYVNKVSAHMLMKDRKKAISLVREGILLSKKKGQKQRQIAKAYNNFAYVMRYVGDKDSAHLYAKKAFEIFKEQKDTLMMGYTYTSIAGYYKEIGNSKEALDAYEKTVQFFEAARDTPSLTKSLGLFSSFQANLGMFANALKTSKRALSISEFRNDSASIARELMVVASAYQKLPNYEMSRGYYHKALKINDQIDNRINQFHTYSNLSNLYSKFNIYDSALWAAKKALNYLDTNARPEQYPIVLKKIVEVHILKKEYSLAKPILENGIKFCKEKDLPRRLIALYGAYGFYYREQLQFKESKEYYLKGLALINKYNSFSPKENYYESLAFVFRNLGDYKNADFYQEKYALHKDSIYKLDRAKTLSEAEVKFANEKRELAFSLLKKDNELKDRKAARQKTLFMGLSGLTLLLGLVSFLGLRSYKLKQRLRIEKFRNKVAADLHDDVGSTLSSIAIYSEVIKSKTKDILPETVPMLDNMTNSSSQLMEAMSDIVWTINPKNNTFQSLLHRIREFAGELCEAKDIKFTFNQKGEIDNLNLNMDSAQNLYLVMKEAINNALKYSKCSKLELDVIKDKKQLSFYVKDNGIGFDIKNPNIGNGVTNMKERMEEIGGNFIIKSNSEGSQIGGVLTVK